MEGPAASCQKVRASVAASASFNLWAIEREARDEKRGLWRDKSPVPPWLYAEQLKTA